MTTTNLARKLATVAVTHIEKITGRRSPEPTRTKLIFNLAAEFDRAGIELAWGEIERAMVRFEMIAAGNKVADPVVGAKELRDVIRKLAEEVPIG